MTARLRSGVPRNSAPRAGIEPASGELQNLSTGVFPSFSRSTLIVILFLTIKSTPGHSSVPNWELYVGKKIHA